MLGGNDFALGLVFVEIPMNPGPVEPEETPYELIGGGDTVTRLVEAFYRRVPEHPDLAPLFPDDLEPVAEKQRAFLTQFFGGPPLFSMEYGPPMLRARHLPHRITPKGAAAWLECMDAALDEAGIKGEVRRLIFGRLTTAARHMVNTEYETLDEYL